MDNPEILIATPAYEGNMKAGYVKSLFAAQAMLHSHGIKHEFVTLQLSDIALSRNYFASYMLERPNFTHLLFIDSDMTFEPITIGRLIVEAKPLIGCACTKRWIDLHRLISLAQKYKDPQTVLAMAHDFTISFPKDSETVEVTDGLVKCASMGMAVCLIARTVFSQLVDTGKLQQHESFNKQGVKGPIYGFFDQTLSDGKPLSEDLSFCERWRTLCGGEVWALVQDRIGHIGPMELGVPYIDRLRAEAV